MKMIKTARLKWLGHIARMEDNVSCMKIKFSQPKCSRKKGMPRIRCHNSVSKEIKTLGVNGWEKEQVIKMCGL